MRLLLAGSPAAERGRRLDDRRVEDLQAIRSEIAVLCVERRDKWAAVLKRALPADLEEVARLAKYERPGVGDPATGDPYGYEPTDGSRYRLCATFDRERRSRFEPRWDHPAGRHCFEIDALE